MHPQHFSHLLQGTLTVIIEAVAQMKHPRLLCCQALKSFLHFFPEHLVTDAITGVLFCLILDKVPKMLIFFLIHRHFQALQFLAVYDDLLYLLRGERQLFANLFE